jgi:pimeloyl-ACP methyl ester carboxylesterase
MRRLLNILRWLFYIFLALLAILATWIVINLKSDLPLEGLKSRWTDKSSRFVDVDGMQVHYRDEGTGPVVVLLHGTSSSLHTWDGWAAGLQKTQRVVRMDLPAFGLTGPSPARDYSPDAAVAFLDHFVAKIGLQQFALAGNSRGGTIAWKYAVAHPDRVRALILVDSGGYPVDNKSGPIAFRLGGLGLGPLLVRLDPRFLVEDGVKKSYGDPGRIRPETVDRYYELTLRPGNREAFLDRMKVPYVDETAQLASIKVPTLVLWGARDNLIPVENAKRFGGAISGARVVVYDDLGHVPMEEDAPRTAAEAARFLAENAPK